MGGFTTGSTTLPKTHGRRNSCPEETSVRHTRSRSSLPSTLQLAQGSEQFSQTSGFGEPSDIAPVLFVPFFENMEGVIFCLTIFLASSPVLAHHGELIRALDADLRPWNQLKRDAGYCTMSGLWRGGLPQFAQSIQQGRKHCANNIGTHCMAWRTAEVSRKKHDGGMCMCEETSEHFCQRWTCDSSQRQRCKGRVKSRECLKLKKLQCSCTKSAKNGRYCSRWRCEMEAGSKGGHVEDYRCVVQHASGDFCRRWHGNASSESTVESSACECFRRGQAFCDAWLCREREITRCDAFGQGWCRVEIAIGVGGGMGLVSFAMSLCCAIRFSQKGNKLTFTQVYSCFILFCLPWLIGVFIWGGIFGLPWVLLMWAIGIAVVLYFTTIKSQGEAVELPTTNSKE